MSKLKIIFMGTPEFAIPSLQILIENKYNVVAVITAPDRPKGRGRKLSPSPVKEFAEAKGLKVLQPTNLKNADFIETIRELDADLQVVVAFRMLPEVIWNMPGMGTFNLHASLLPQYRGAAPINWAIINGEIRTGLTTFFIQHEIDTGNIIKQVEEEIKPDDNVASLHDRLMQKGADLVLDTVKIIQTGTMKLSRQVDDPELKKAPKLFKEMCQIDWSNSATTVYNFIRGLSPYPGAYCILNDKKYKILKASVAKDISKLKDAGNYLEEDGKRLFIKCGQGLLSVEEIQPEGKKRMLTEDFFRGNRI